MVVFSLAGCAHKGDSGSQTFSIPKAKAMRIVVFPIDNMSGSFVPVSELRGAWIKKLEDMGLPLIDEKTLENTLARHRIRFIGGVDTTTAKAFREETGADAILITSLEYYSENYPPKLAIISRLTSTEERPRILWMDSVGLSGDDSPGILGLGLITDLGILREKALQRLAASLARWINDKDRICDNSEAEAKYMPKAFYSELPVASAKKTSIAVVPLFNESIRKRAGEIMQSHLTRQLACIPGIDPVEPGVIREKMLGIRMIMPEGVSIRDVDVLTYILDTDFVLSGKVFDYQDPRGGAGTPKIDFSTLLVNRGERKVVWLSKSYNNGDDGVYFYDVGRENNANVMAAKMAGSVVQIMTEEKSPATYQFVPPRFHDQ
jgi:hypothetical protein